MSEQHESSAGPVASVVIPTHGREARLAFALEALAGQGVGRERFEVIVVRDRGAPGPHAKAPEGLDVRFLECEPGRGPATKRNLGWREARGELVAFTDDDCRATAGWLEALLDRWGGDERVVVQGRTLVDPDEAHLLFGLARTTQVLGPTPWLETCNIAYPRALIEELGGFDEDFTFGGEDTDLGLRAIEAGADHRFAGEALCYHAVVAPVFWRAIRSADRRRTDALVLARHPELRRHLVLGVFQNRAHAAITLGCVATAAVPLAGWPGLLGWAPYLGMTLAAGGGRPRRTARVVAQLPARLARDLVELSGTVRGAIRHRTVMI